MLTKRQKHIISLLESKNRKTVNQGIQILLIRKGMDVIIEKITKSYVFGYIIYDMMKYLKNNKALAEKVYALIPDHYKSEYNKLMKNTLFYTDSMSQQDYCKFVSKQIQEIFKGFPKIKFKDLKVAGIYTFACIKAADTRKDGIGWVLDFTSSMEGPAECINKEEWWAKAYYKDKVVSFCYLSSTGSFTRLWMGNSII